MEKNTKKCIFGCTFRLGISRTIVKENTSELKRKPQGKFLNNTGTAVAIRQKACNKVYGYNCMSDRNTAPLNDIYLPPTSCVRVWVIIL